jgi:ketosteroid isomerase-like protein
MKTGILTSLFFLPFSLMAQPDNAVSEDVLQSFADAFNAHDLDAIMSLMTQDCVFEASAGPDVDGQKFTGQPPVRHVFEEVLTTFPDAQWSHPRHLISGDRGLSEWTFTWT